MLLCIAAPVHSPAAVEPFTERGKTDFDTFLALLAPHGEWGKDENKKWAFTPHAAKNAGWRPYQNGQWKYTDWGWFWDTSEPFAFACYHYGYWTRSPDGVWRWHPGSRWEASLLEWRVTAETYGWRPRITDAMGEWVEDFRETVSLAEECLFTKKEQVVFPLKPEIFFPVAENSALLGKSDISTHIYSIPSYRDFTRMGPEPDDLAIFAGAKNLKRYKIMSLPSPDTAVPKHYDDTHLFVYRPSFHQDTDGLLRRVGVWMQRQQTGEKVDTQKITESLMEEVIKKKAEKIRKEKSGEE